MTAAASSSGPDRRVWLLAAAVFLAWLPALQSYYHNGDEYLYLDLFDHGLGGALRDHVSHKGLQRLLAYAWAVPLAAVPVQLIGPICVGVHLITTLVFFKVAAIITRSSVIALALAVVWGVYPLGYYAVVWSPGTYAMLHLTLALAAFLILHRHKTRPCRMTWLPYVLSGVALMISGCIGEYLLFALPLLGLLACCAVREQRVAEWRAWLRDPVVWWPVVVTGVILALIALSKPHGLNSVENAAIGDLDWQKLNPRSVLSVWYYQHAAVFMLQPWLRGDAWHTLFQTWTVWMMAAAAALVPAIAWFVFRFQANDLSLTQNDKRPPLMLGLVLVLLLPAVSVVHMLAGGYKGDSRHNYIPAAMALLLVGWAIARWLPGLKLPRLLGLLALLLCVLTNWLVLGVYRFESRRHQALIQFAFEQRVSGPVRLVFEPPLYHAFPIMAKTMSHGFGEGWCFDWALSYKRHAEVQPRTPTQLTLTDAADAPVVSISGRGPAFQLTLNGSSHATAVLSP